MTQLPPGLRSVARAYGIQTSYIDVSRTRRRASRDAILSTLRSLGVDVDPSRPAAALRALERADWERGLEPVSVAWNGRIEPQALRRLGAATSEPVHCELRLEDGARIEWTHRAPGRAAPREVDGAAAVEERIVAPRARLPLGYHWLHVRYRNRESTQLVISAPASCYAPGEREKEWGVFMPLYALRRARSWGSGDLGDLEALEAWVHASGGSVVATLPLLAAFLSRPFDPSPYSPVSRLFWNEVYLDVERVVAGVSSEAARRRLSSPEAREKIAQLRAAERVDFRGAAALRHWILAPAADQFFASGGERTPDFEQFLRDNQDAMSYAGFRAACEAHRAGWPAWSAGETPETRGLEDAEVRYHLFAQFAMSGQLRSVSERASASGGRFYLDLPLGVRGDGYDVWAYRPLFVQGASAGAPPDPFFSRGQSWGFPPPHPGNLRAAHYGYFIRVLRNHMRYAGVLRLDHVMALHRLYWIPEGADPRDGLYVRYEAEEMYAILSLESHRHQTRIVGEDLGTVPREVRSAMRRHGVLRMAVLQFEATPDRPDPMPRPPSQRVASINTHDMPPFAAFWRGDDIEDRVALGLLDEEGAEAERRSRAQLRRAVLRVLRKDRPTLNPDDPVAVHGACVARYGSSAAWLVLVNLEDLWGETEPQNTPGTSTERPNWTRRSARAMEELIADREVTEVLHELDRARGGREKA